ncbi:hypothetical protein V6N12_023801 [Hibiscus sabdariffa]|uniref:Uncharacterized protein n=1 Tax=Hibiscus sabdariffa TaxID=183260 RepID=A0ABR2FYR1_9ROSI
MMSVIGMSMMYTVGPFINWRILALIESPRWLVKVGRETEFETALRSLRGKRANVFEEANSIKGCTDSLKRFSWRQMLDLFQQKYVHSLVIGIGIMVLQHSGGDMRLSEYVGLSTLAAVEVSSGGLCLGSFLTGTSFLLQDHDMWSEGTPILALISIWVYMGSYQVGMAVIPWIIVAEWSSAGTFLIFSAICCLSVVFIAKLVPETKGRTLEEIHASLTSSSPW